MSHMMNIEEIKRYLPHRFPFLYVDRVLHIEQRKLIAIKNVTANEPFFIGHFPIRMVMPGVLIIEALAQASGILMYKIMGTIPHDDIFFLAAVDKVRFKRVVIPGDQLELHVEIIKHKQNVWKFHGIAKVGYEVACVAEFMNVKEPSRDRLP